MPVDPAFIRHLDDTIRTGLEASRDYWSGWVEASTSAVVIGCVMEGPEVLHEFFPNLFKEKHVRVVKLIATVGLGFVILGVAGELVFTHYAGQYEGQLQTFNATLLTDAQVQIAATERQTAQVRIETGLVQRDTQALKTEADVQRAMAGAANLKAAQANERAEKLEVEAASLRRGFSMLGDRSRLFDERKALMGFWDALKPFKGQKAQVRYMARAGTVQPIDRETFDVAYEIETAMAAGDWQVNFPLSIGMPSEAKGIYLLVCTAASIQTLARREALLKAMSELPLDITVMKAAEPVEFQSIANYGPQLPSYGDVSKWPKADDQTILVIVAGHFPSGEFNLPTSP